jgi:hypothetical protein
MNYIMKELKLKKQKVYEEIVYTPTEHNEIFSHCCDGKVGSSN